MRRVWNGRAVERRFSSRAFCRAEPGNDFPAITQISDPWRNSQRRSRRLLSTMEFSPATEIVCMAAPEKNLSQHRFLGFIQNHDQVGNRAVGDRIAQSAGADRAKIAAALVLLGPFIPMLFQGEEWAASSPFLYFADHSDRKLARQVIRRAEERIQCLRLGSFDNPRSRKSADIRRSQR